MTTPTDPRLTEARNPRTRSIDRADALDIVGLMGNEDGRVAAAVSMRAPEIAAVIEDVTARVRCGGRLVYVGAGTSGRLGMLDAAECPPTFGVSPDLVRGVIAGGVDALVRSSEGAEDDPAGGARAVAEFGIGPVDFVLGIATSGTTPFVHGALDEAGRRGAGRGFLCCSEPPEGIAEGLDHVILPLVGPEVIAGSTRLKAGTATKMVLNMISTGVMIRSGRVYENLMVDLRARSAKLVDRGLRIVQTVTELDRDDARARLLEAGGAVKTALAMELLGADRWTAERLLDMSGGVLATAVSRFTGAPRPEYEAYPDDPTERDVATLLTRLGTAPDRMTTAAREAAEIDVSGRRVPARAGGWSAAQHTAHLLDFETGAIGPRVRAWSDPGGDAFDPWQPSVDPPPHGDLGDVVRAFAAERRRTFAAIDRDPAGLRRRARVGGEDISLYQFLSGIAGHDDGHVARAGERVHPALLATRTLGDERVPA
ncbi:MAG: N-acetylmuramic acid 6-phosphate etherase [Gemmatimonadetes bacterium]|nr:N-acetylmuramic acid 6-phosphate etherase [Gemmatimonadota bacterium]